jgi:hypothetical protein
MGKLINLEESSMNGVDSRKTSRKSCESDDEYLIIFMQCMSVYGIMPEGGFYSEG